MRNNDVILGPGPPLEERIGPLAEEWLREGRGSDRLVTGKAFFALYSWYLRHRTDHGIRWSEYVVASYDFIGGRNGWEAMLRERTVCESCCDTYRMENIGLCTGCMRYTCYACGAHPACAGEVV